MKNYDLNDDTERMTRKEKPGKQADKPLVVILSFFIVGVITMLMYNNHYTASKISYSVPSAYNDPERTDPTQFILARGSFHPNFWGNGETIIGTVTNLAHHTNYKDIRIKVNFLSQTNSVVSSQEFILYQYVPTGSTKAFTLPIQKPEAAVSCDWTATGGTYY